MIVMIMQEKGVIGGGNGQWCKGVAVECQFFWVSMM
jgi:hypothetical protein